MRLQIINETGKPHDTRVIDLDTGQNLPVTRIEIAPMTAENAWCPAVTITFLPQHLSLVTDRITVAVEWPEDAL